MFFNLENCFRPESISLIFFYPTDLGRIFVGLLQKKKKQGEWNEKYTTWFSKLGPINSYHYDYCKTQTFSLHFDYTRKLRIPVCIYLRSPHYCFFSLKLLFFEI